MCVNKLVGFLFLIIFCQPLLLMAEDGPIVIGGSLGLTGKFSAMADMKHKGFRLWEEHVNREGGLLGRKVKVVIHDDNSKKENAIEIYRKSIEEEKVDLLLGPYSSSITGAVMPLIERHGYPILASGAAADGLWQKGYRHIFGIFIPGSRYAVGFLEMIAMNGIEKVAIISADDTFSSVMAAGSKKWARSFGLDVSVDLTFKKGTRDLSPIAGQLAAAKVPAVVVCGHFNEAVDMQMALKKVGYQPTAYFASIGPALDKYHAMLGKDADLSFSSSQWELSLAHKSGDKAVFLTPFREKYGVDPTYHAANAFAAGQILAAAVKKAGSLDRTRIRDILASLNFVSIIGRYGVDKAGMQVKHFPINVQWQDGVKRVVWPEELATGQPRFVTP